MRRGKATIKASSAARGPVLALVAAAGIALGCAGVLGKPAHYEYFGTPAVDDAWSSKISAWQLRERSGSTRSAVDPAGGSEVGAGPAATPRPNEGLRGKYLSFQSERKRETAREFMAWIQTQASDYYIADGPLDHWATLEETLRSDGDDCDGLELLVFHALRDQGFADDEVYRAVVHRPSDGQHHMVTLWFEHPDDPWVIDPTGAMTHDFVRMSDLPEWAPLKVFSDTEEYTARHDRAKSRN